MNTSMNTSSLKAYLLPIVAVLVIIVLVPLVILPLFTGIQTNWSTWQAKKELSAQVAAKAEALMKVDNAANESLLLLKAEPAMPSEADPSGVLATLEQIASAAGVTPKGGRFTDTAATTPAPAGGAVHVSISVQGTYPNIYTFIKQSENVARVVSLESMHILAGTGTGSDQLVATFDVSAPYAPMPTDLVSVETPLPEMGPSQTALLDKVAKLNKANYAPTQTSAINGRPSPF